jgi:hypothetical protein
MALQRRHADNNVTATLLSSSSLTGSVKGEAMLESFNKPNRSICSLGFTFLGLKGPNLENQIFLAKSGSVTLFHLPSRSFKPKISKILEAVLHKNSQLPT